MNRQPVTRSSRPAFSLLEVLIAVSILSSIAAVGGPALFRWHQRMELSTTANALCVRLQKAQIRAGQEGQIYMLEIYDDGYSIASSDNSHSREYKTGRDTTLAAPNSYSVDNRRVILTPDGRIRPRQILLSRGTQRITITPHPVTNALLKNK